VVRKATGDGALRDDARESLVEGGFNGRALGDDVLDVMLMLTPTRQLSLDLVATAGAFARISRIMSTV
jgi:hypothetical protein